MDENQDFDDLIILIPKYPGCEYVIGFDVNISSLRNEGAFFSTLNRRIFDHFAICNIVAIEKIPKGH